MMTTASTHQRASIWQVHDAKSRFAELIRRASDAGPQTITRYGKPVAVVVSPHIVSLVDATPPLNFGEFLLTMPKLSSAEAKLFIRSRRSRSRLLTPPTARS